MSRANFRADNFGAGGAAAGPYPSSGAAFRAAVLEGRLAALDQGGMVLQDYDGTSFTGVPEGTNANDLYDDLAIDSAVAEGDAIGGERLYDAGNDAFLPEASRRSFSLGLLADTRDAGLTRSNATDDDTTPGWETDTLYDGSDTYSWHIRTATRVSGASGFVASVLSVPAATGDGVRFSQNDGAFTMFIRANDGAQTSLQSSALGGGTTPVSGTINASTTYDHVWSIERTDTDRIKLTVKVFDTSGTLVYHKHRSSTDFTAAEMPTSHTNAIVGFEILRSYPGIALCDASNSALLDDVLDGTDITAGGTMDVNYTGVRTGVYRPSDPDALIYSTGSGDDVLAVARRV